MSKIRCLIVDDEALARAQLQALLDAQPDAVTAGQAANLTQARKALGELMPDLVLLDIHLRNESGFDLVAELDPAIAVIFVTAHQQHAVRAFDTDATDYLLKPVSAPRLRRALERAKASLAERRAREDRSAKLMRLGLTGDFIAAEDILYITAEGHHCRVATAGGGLKVVRQPFGEWLEQLPVSDLAQLDRGTVVNLRRLGALAREVDGCRVGFKGESTQLELGATAYRRLREFLTGKA